MKVAKKVAIILLIAFVGIQFIPTKRNQSDVVPATDIHVIYNENHINEGKAELNFNEFGDYSGRRQKSKLKSIASQIRDNEMPLASYTIIHRDAKLSEKEKELIIQWVDKTMENL